MFHISYAAYCYMSHSFFFVGFILVYTFINANQEKHEFCVIIQKHRKRFICMDPLTFDIWLENLLHA